MKKLIQTSLAVLALSGALSAQAETFEVASGTSFTQYFTFTPTLTNGSGFAVTAPSAQLGSLGYELLNGEVVVAQQTDTTGILLVTLFNDVNFSGFDLVKNTAYTLKVTGQAKPSLTGGYGVVSITAKQGTISPVPEPESYAMFLAGLGLMGAIARRRSTKA